MVSVPPKAEEEKKDVKQKDIVDIVLDDLRKSNTFKCNKAFIKRIGDASYMTVLGELRGNFIVSPYFLIFDPDISEENKPLIPVPFELHL